MFYLVKFIRARTDHRCQVLHEKLCRSIPKEKKHPSFLLKENLALCGQFRDSHILPVYRTAVAVHSGNLFQKVFEFRTIFWFSVEIASFSF